MGDVIAHDTSVEQAAIVESGLKTFHTIPRRQIAAAAKRVLDIVGAIVLICLLWPLMLAIALTIAMGGGPILFRHPRVGLRGRAFLCLKFRTMSPDAEIRLRDMLEKDPEIRREWETTQKMRDDPRTTRFGKFLRRSSLDELPQLFNVVGGHMSLVGPRPVTAEELERHYKRLGMADKYIEVRPGITGLWQVSGRSDTSYEFRVALDEQYIEFRSIIMDLRILSRTALVVCRRNGAC